MKNWFWCLLCARCFEAEYYPKKCYYDDCSGRSGDFYEWEKIRLNNVVYPKIPQVYIKYPMFSLQAVISFLRPDDPAVSILKRRLVSKEEKRDEVEKGYLRFHIKEDEKGRERIIETKQAIGIRDFHNPKYVEWFPKSVVKYDLNRTYIDIPVWLAKKKMLFRNRPREI
jgi:hypothetical protein